MLNKPHLNPLQCDQLKNIAVLLSYCLFSVILSACVSLTAPTPASHYHVQSYNERAQSLNAITCWTASGAFSVTTPKESGIANYVWQLTDQTHFKVDIASTLNVYQLAITREGSSSTLIKNQHQSLVANNPETLMQQSVGYSLPVSNLYYWMRGIAAPGKYQAQYDQYGHITQLSQQGWTITFLNYNHVDTVDLPQLIQLKRKDLSVKLVVKKWDLACQQQSTKQRATP